MKKILSKALVLLLAFSLVFGAMGVWGATVTFEVEGRVVETVESVNGEVVLPEKPLVMNGQFVGWSGTLHGEKFLLPAGTVLEGVDKDLTVTAETFFYFKTNTMATVRIMDGDLGLRFTSTLSMEDYDRLVNLVGQDNVKLGTYIMPDQYLKAAGRIFDLEHMAKYGIHEYLDVPAKKFFKVDHETKKATIAGSVSQVLEKNRALDFCACGYMKLTYTNGETETFYADFIYAETKHNLADRVFKAYNDRKVSYPNSIPYIEGKVEHGKTASHSPYTIKELDLMKEMMHSVAYVDRVLDDPYDYINVKSDYYDSPWLISRGEHNNATGKNTVIVAPAEGHSISELKAVCLENHYRSMATDVNYTNGTFRFMDSEWTSVNGSGKN